MLRHCWLGDRKGILPIKTGCWFVGGDDLTEGLHVLQQNQNGDILVPANPSPPGKWPFKWRENEPQQVHVMK